ncbi:MAG TPA: hypothetical protein VJU77_15640 [Chthoniobacterales bacterium]|nr:hypothetical protein [Chthoniobacterales bacterium]
MKTKMIICLAIAASVAVISPTTFAKEKSADTKAVPGKSVVHTGTVKKIPAGVCPLEGAKWDLLSNVGQPIHLAAANAQVGKALDKAADSHETVRVEGTQVAGVECPHVKVTKVTPVPKKK